MRSIDALVRDSAKAITNGDLPFLRALVDVPNSVYLGDRLLYIPDADALTRILLQYRINVLRKGYVRTEFRNAQSTIIGPRYVRVTLDWVDLDQDDAEITVGDMCIYLTRTSGCAWRVMLISVVDMPAPDLMEGLVVY